MFKKRGKFFEEIDLPASNGRDTKVAIDVASSSSSSSEDDEIENIAPNSDQYDDYKQNELQAQSSSMEDEMYENCIDDTFIDKSSGYPPGNSAGEEERNLTIEETYLQTKDVLQFEILESSKNTAFVKLLTDNEIFINGCVQIKVLKGCISCQGFNILPSQSFTNIYSPRGHTLLGIRACLEENSSEEYLQQFLTQENMSLSTDNEKSVIFLARRFSESWLEYFDKNFKGKYKHFGRVLEKNGTVDSLTPLEELLNVTILRKIGHGIRVWMKGQEWDVAKTSVDITIKNGKQPKLIATGGKGVGKSSFLRWMTNQLMNEKGGEVLFLDLDPGQKEFGLPGYMSLSCLDKPVLGPNFCQAEPKWQKSVYLGDISPGSNPRRYVECVSLLLKCLSEHTKLPVLVNTMGWCQGLGMMLNIEIIRRLSPTTVVQLNSSSYKSNFPSSLTSQYVSSKKSSWSKTSTNLSYSLLEFNSVNERNDFPVLRPNILRDIQTCAWLGKRSSIQEWAVYNVPMSCVALTVLHKRVSNYGLLAALASRFVDLYHVEEECIRKAKDGESYSLLSRDAVSLSIGIGFIRGIERSSNLIYVATEVDPEKLQDVNCIAGGALELPTSLQKQVNIGPYLAPNTGNPLELRP